MVGGGGGGGMIGSTTLESYLVSKKADGGHMRAPELSVVIAIRRVCVRCSCVCTCVCVWVGVWMDVRVHRS